MVKEHKAKAADKHLTDVSVTPQRIALRAYELYEQRGRVDGFDLQDWLQAQQDVLSETEQSAASASDERARGRRPARSGRRR